MLEILRSRAPRVIESEPDAGWGVWTRTRSGQLWLLPLAFRCCSCGKGMFLLALKGRRVCRTLSQAGFESCSWVPMNGETQDQGMFPLEFSGAEVAAEE